MKFPSQTFMKGLFAALFLFFLINDAFAQGIISSPSATARLRTKDEVEASLKRTFGYDPSLTWNIHDIRQSAIPGITDILISINNQGPQHIYMSNDTQNAIPGEMIPFGPDPFVPVRVKLRAADGPSKGSQTPAISIVEFSDLECPHCKAAQPVLEKLLTDFPQARLAFQQFPLLASMHPWAMKAATYADCVGQLSPGAFWKYINTVFENQGSIVNATAEDKLKEFATAAGLDAQQISTCSGLPQTEAKIKKSLDLAGSLDVTQAPTLFVNGRRVLAIADIPYEQLKNLVQFEIGHAGK